MRKWDVYIKEVVHIQVYADEDYEAEEKALIELGENVDFYKDQCDTEVVVEPAEVTE